MIAGSPIAVARPDFETMLLFWKELLAERGLPRDVQWVFAEDFARLPKSFAFRPRPAAEAARVADFTLERLDPKRPLAMVAYAVIDGIVVTGFQGDYFTADEDVYREDWNIFFDAKENWTKDCRIIVDEMTWMRVRAEQPKYLSEPDYLVSIEILRRKYGYRD